MYLILNQYSIYSKNNKYLQQQIKNIKFQQQIMNRQMKTVPAQPPTQSKQLPPTNFKTNHSYSSPKTSHFKNLGNVNGNNNGHVNGNVNGHVNGNDNDNIVRMDDGHVYGNGNISKKLFGNNFNDATNYGDIRELLRQSQRRIATITLTEMGKQNVDNRDFRQSAYTKILNSISNTQQLQLLHNEHRIQVQKLLLQISRLHDIISQLERTKKYQLHKLKQQYQQATYLHLSNIKQSQSAQVEILELQLRKNRAALQQKSNQYEDLLRASNKERDMLQGEIEVLRGGFMEALERKNGEIERIGEGNREQIERITRESGQAIQEMREGCDRELRKLQVELTQKQYNLSRTLATHRQTEQKTAQLEQKIQQQRLTLQQKLQTSIIDSNNRYNTLLQNIERMFEQQSHNYDGKQNLLKQTYESEIRNLLEIIRVKGSENERIKGWLEMERVAARLMGENIEKENQYLRGLVKTIQVNNMQQLQQLKVRMAILHQNDLKQLVKLYQSKIQCLQQQLHAQSAQSTRLRQHTHQQCQHWYTQKKTYEQKLSKLNVQILRLRNGLGSMQKDMKQQFENERSAMLLTSKSLIRGVEMKNTNVRFYEDELRKLRAVVEKLEGDGLQQEEEYRAQIRKLEEDVRRVMENSRHAEQEFHRLEQQYTKTLQSKDNQIKRLNKLARQLIEQSKHDDSQQLQAMKKAYQDLHEQLRQKTQKIKQLQNKLQKLQRQLQDTKIQNQQLYLQNQINHQQAKGEYQKISQSSTRSLKQFYQRRIQELQRDKTELKMANSAGEANLAELIRKYNLLQEYMGKMVKQARKRTLLEERIVGLGMDGNLVRNKVELFGRDCGVEREGLWRE